jgi:predicted  nucleic acid-binding Zn-ribbon protein
MEPLLALQDVDTQIDELQRELHDIPIRRQQESARLQGAQERLSAAQAELRAFQTRVADFELQVKAVREQITKLRQQQMTLKTNKEFRAMETEINNGLHEAEALEGQQIMAMDAVPPAQSRVDAAQERYDVEKAGMAAHVADLDSRLALVKERLAALEAERDAALKQVPPAHLRRYERLRNGRRPTVVPLKDGICSGCHLQQTASTRHQVQRKNALVACESCGRILYS